MKRIIAIAAVALLVTSCSQKTPTIQVERTAQTEHLLSSLKQLTAEGKYLFGHEDDAFYGVEWNDVQADSSDVMAVCGDRPSLLGVSLGHIELDHENNLDGVAFDAMRQAIIRQYERGGLSTICWHLDNPLTGGTCWVNTEEDGGAMQAVMTGAPQHQKLMEWIDRVAAFLKSLKTADGTPVPVIFRPWHEHNASWFWFGKNFCTPEEYITLWRITVERLAADGVNNVLYAYSPTAEGGIDETSYMERYPGDDIIDVMGLDSYCFPAVGDEQGVAKYAARLDTDLAMLCALAEKHGKVPALTEAGYEGLPYERWWTEALAPALSHNHVAYVMVWRNADSKPGHFYGPFPGQLSADDFVDFYRLPETLFLSDQLQLY